jgi:transmembrane sensor
LELESTHIDNLIAKYLAGETSKKEFEELTAWMESTPENKKYFEGIRFVHDKAISSHAYVKVDSNKAWEKVNRQMVSAPCITAKPKRLIYQNEWFRIAASIMLLLGLSFFIYTFFLKSSEQGIITTISSTNSVLEHTIDHNTLVVLNRNSHITYTTKKKGKKKELNLIGEAFIKVHHSADTILIVKAEETFIRDIGTSFNVKAYPDSSIIEVFVETGEVFFYTTNNSGINLQQGETGIYHKTEKKFTRITNKNINVIAYKTKMFVFRNTKLGDALKELNAVATETITLEDPNLINCIISVSFDNETTRAIAEIIAETLSLQVVKTKNGYTLKGESRNNR